MTVRQLIAELSALPPEKQEMTVYTYSSDGYYELVPEIDRSIELAYYPSDMGDVQVIISDGEAYPTTDIDFDEVNNIENFDIVKLVGRTHGICV